MYSSLCKMCFEHKGTARFIYCCASLCCVMMTRYLSYLENRMQIKYFHFELTH